MSYTEVELSMVRAWEGIESWVMAEEGEFERRWARRGSREFLRPLQAFCVAVRASDHRVNDTWAEIMPRHALSLEALAHPGRYVEHQVVITDDLVKRACAPYHIAPPGEPADHVAAKLGCGPGELRRYRKSGFLWTNLKPRLMGRRGKPVPLVYVGEHLNPSARGKRRPDFVFGRDWMNGPDWMPEGFRQTVVRVPRYRRERGREMFHGWRWVCPCCRKNADKLYYPLSHPDLALMLGFVGSMGPWGQRHAPVFACWACHGVKGFRRTDLDGAWNRLVLHYSGGLLYGHEVERPAWLKPEKAEARPARRESAKRLAFKRLLVETELNLTEIGRRMGTGPMPASRMARRIYEREGVKGREELREKLGGAHPVEQVGRRMVG